MYKILLDMKEKTFFWKFWNLSFYYGTNILRVPRYLKVNYGEEGVLCKNVLSLYLTERFKLLVQ